MQEKIVSPYEVVSKKEFKDYKTKNELEHRDLMKTQDKMMIALYGDGNGKEGIVKMIYEMHDVFVGTTWAKKLLIGLLAFIGSCVGITLGVIKIFKSF